MLHSWKKMWNIDRRERYRKYEKCRKCGISKIIYDWPAGTFPRHYYVLDNHVMQTQYYFTPPCRPGYPYWLPANADFKVVVGRQIAHIYYHGKKSVVCGRKNWKHKWFVPSTLSQFLTVAKLPVCRECLRMMQ